MNTLVAQMSGMGKDRGPGENENVKVTGPEEGDKVIVAGANGDVPPACSPQQPSKELEDESRHQPEAPSTKHALKREHEGHAPLEERVPTLVHEHAEAKADTNASIAKAATPHETNGRPSHDDNESEDYHMPGAFHIRAPHHGGNGHHHHLGWLDFFRKMHIKA